MTMVPRTIISTVIVATVLWCYGADLWAAPGTVELETGEVLEGDVRFVPEDQLELVVTDSQDTLSIPLTDIKSVQVDAPSTVQPESLPLLKRLWRRLTGPPEQQETITVTLRSGEVHTGWLSWRQSAGEIEVRESDYIVRKAYVKHKQIDRGRHQPIDIRKRYVRSITLADEERVVLKKCPTCNRTFEQPDYEYCPYDGTPLNELPAAAQE